MYNYNKLSKNVAEGMKTAMNTVVSVVAIPLTLPGIRMVTKTAIKGGLFVSDKTETYYKQIEGEWNQIVKEGKEEIAEKPASTKTAKQNKEQDYESWNVEDLYELAQEFDIKGRSSMKKQELIKEIRKASAGQDW